MKITDVRSKIKDLDQKTLNDLFSVAYKELPKAKKEIVDEYLNDPSLLSKPKEKPSVFIDYETLFSDIAEFISDAEAGLYFRPNRAIPKAVRSKWRFTVKNYFKTLLSITPDDTHYKQALVYNLALYKTLCHGCKIYLFSSNDPFASIGIEQGYLFQQICVRFFHTAYTDEEMKALIVSSCTSGLDMNTIHLSLYASIVDLTSSKYERDRIIMLAKEVLDQYRKEYFKAVSNHSSWDAKYYLEEAVRNVLIFIALLELKNDNLKEGIIFYWANALAAGSKDFLYYLLDAIDAFGTDEDWINTYNQSCKLKHFKDIESLNDKYKQKMSSLSQ